MDTLKTKFSEMNRNTTKGFNVELVEIQDPFCENVSDAVDKMKASSRTAVFCLNPFEYRSILEEMMNRKEPNTNTKNWNLFYIDMNMDYHSERCTLWSNHRDGEFSCTFSGPDDKVDPVTDILPGIWDTTVISLRHGVSQQPNPFTKHFDQSNSLNCLASCQKNPYQNAYYEALFILGRAISITLRYSMSHTV